MSVIQLNVEQFIKDVQSRPAIWNRNYHCNKFFMEQTWDELAISHKLPVRTLKVKWKGLRDNFRVEYKRMPRSETGELMILPEEHESKWVHFHALLFLTEHMRHRNNNSLVAYPECDDSLKDEEVCIVEPDILNGLVQHDYDGNDTDVKYNLKFEKPYDPSEGAHDLSINSAPKRKRSEPSNRRESDDCKPEMPSTTTFSNSWHDATPVIPAATSTIIPHDDDYFYLMSLHPYMKLLSPSQKLRVRTKVQKLILKDLYKEDLD